MDKKFIVTIGRQTGSGGHEIGRLLAAGLNIKCYDKELLERAAKESGLAEELFHAHDEQPTSSFLYSLVMDTYSLGHSSAGHFEMPINQKVFLAQFDSIKKLAGEESCVIVGRCADYALSEFPNLYRIYVYADDEDRVKRLVSRIDDLDEKKAREMMLKSDKKRANYYNYYSNKKWGDPSSYDLCINSSVLGIEGTAEFIRDYVMKAVSQTT